MKLKAGLSLFLIVVMLTLPVLSACSGVSFKIDFIVDGEIYDSLDTNGSEVVKLPANPTKDGYDFEGWYWDDITFTRPFTANSLLEAPLTGDMKVYAKMVEVGSQAVTPVPNTAYKLFVDQENTGVRYYLNGKTDSYYLACNADIEASVNVYVENAELQGKYHLFAVVEGVRQYINIINNAGYYNAVYNNAPITAYSYDAQLETLVATVDGNKLVLAINTAVNYSRVGVRYIDESNFLTHFAVSSNPDSVIPDTVAIEADIANVQSGALGLYKTTGTVIAVNAQSFLIDDGTGKILVYKGLSWVADVKVGDVVSLQGKTTIYSLGKQFGTDTEYTVTGTANVERGEPKAVTDNEINAYAYKTEIIPEYIKLVGVVELSGTYYNLNLGAGVITGSIVYPMAEDKALLTSLAGKTVEVIGYATSVTGGGQYLSIMAVSITESNATVNPDPAPNPNQPQNPVPEVLDTPEKIVNAAYGLQDGEQINGTYTLTGVITSIDVPYDAEWQNVTVTMVVGNMTDKPIKCYRLSGNGSDVINIGDTITVSGTLTNYQGTIEFRQGCTLDSYTLSAVTPTEATIAEVLSGGAGLYTTGGRVAGYNAKSFLLEDNGAYILVWCGADWQRDVALGDSITVTGTTSVYGGAMQFDNSAEYSITASGTYEQPSPIELGAEALNAYANMSTVTPIFVKAIGKLYAVEGVYTVVVDGANVQIRISYPTLALEAFDGLTVEVVGYVTGTIADGVYISLMTSTVTDLTDEPEITTSTIAEVIAGDVGAYRIEGTVIAKNAQSYLVKDSTGIILVFEGDAPDVGLGDTLRVTGKTKVYGMAKQFSANEGEYTVEKIGTVSITYPTPTVLNADAINDYASVSDITPHYVKVKATIVKSASYYNLTFEGTNITGSIPYPADTEALDALVGVEVEIVGYVIYVSGSGTKYLNILPIELSKVNTEPEPEPDVIDTPEEIVNAAYALEEGESLEGTYTLTGVITGVTTAYNSTYGNVTVVIAVMGIANKPITCFRMTGEGADIINIGDSITVSGTLTNYQGTIEFAQGCTLDSYVPAEVAPTPTVATIAEVLSGDVGLYTTSGRVAGYNARSFLLEDNGSYILVYRGTSWNCDVEVGTTVTVTGTTTLYSGAKQFGDSASYEITGKSDYTHPTVNVLNTDELNAYKTAESITVKYVKVVGVLNISTNAQGTITYYNLAIDGAAITGSITYPIAADATALAALEGQAVAIEGYVTGVTGGGAFLSIMTVNISAQG